MSTRTITVKATWETCHTFEIDSGIARIGKSDLEGAMNASGEDVTADAAELVDWEVEDRG